MKPKDAKTPPRTPLTVSVLYTMHYGEISDCTNGGITSLFESVILVPEGAEPPNPILTRLPIFKVVRRSFGSGDYLHAEPMDRPGSNTIGSWMFGGNFVYSSDSRYREWVGDYPIAVHDRTESPDQYRQISI